MRRNKKTKYCTVPYSKISVGGMKSIEGLKIEKQIFRLKKTTTVVDEKEYDLYSQFHPIGSRVRK